MKTLTVKIPDELSKKLRQEARRTGMSVSEMVRKALNREAASGVPNFSEMAAPYCGMFSGPKGLSAREGYGSSLHR
jgi:plasmid stability protein